MRVGTALAALAGSLTLTTVPQLLADPVDGSEYVLNRKTYTSPSARFELSVDPSEPFGSGPATYRMVRDGSEVWSMTRTFSLWDAVVTDDGRVAGYAYEGGVLAPGHHGAGYRGLAIIVIETDGRVLLRELWDSAGRDGEVNEWSGSDSPRVLGIFVAPRHDLFVLRVPSTQRGRHVDWWQYRLSTGDRLTDITPTHPPADKREYVVEQTAIPVPETNLVLVHWYTRAWTDSRSVLRSAVLSLLDLDGNELWRREFVDEYGGQSRMESGALGGSHVAQVTTEPGGFTFRSHSLSASVTYRIVPDREEQHGIHVAARGRIPIAAPFDRQGLPHPSSTPIQLEYLGKIRLASERQQKNSLEGLRDFALDHEGNIGVLRAAQGTRLFQLWSPAGELLTSMELSQLWGALSYSSGSRWLIRNARSQDDDKARSWWLDSAARTVVPAPHLHGEHMALTPNGEFLTVTEPTPRRQGWSLLNYHDHRGLKLWSTEIEEWPQSIRGLAWKPGSGPILLTVKELIAFDATGEPVNAIPLASVLQREPRFVSDLAVGPRGDVVITDSFSTASVHVLDKNGRHTSSFEPTLDDGRRFEHARLELDSSGRVWTVAGPRLFGDKYGVVRLSDAGRVELSLGRQVDDHTLEGGQAIAIDRDGTIYVLNRRTAAVHIFDTLGNEVAVMAPKPADYSRSGEIAGHTQPRPQPAATRGQASDRLGYEALVNSVRGELLFQPDSSKRWLVGRDTITLIGAEGRRRTEIKRRADGDWLVFVVGAAVAENGSLAVVSTSSRFGHGSGDLELSVYDAEGGSRRSLSLVREEEFYGRMAFDGSIAVAVQGDHIFFYDVAGLPPRRFKMSSEVREDHCTPFFSPDGLELWLASPSELVVHRYKLTK